MRKTLSQPMVDITKEILASKVTNIHKVSAVLYSLSDPSFSLELEDIGLTIYQDHISNYTDIIKLLFSVSLPEYVKIINLYQDLRCNLVLISDYDSKMYDKEETAPWKIDRKVIFEIKDDLFKTHHKSEIIHDEKYIQTESHNSKRIDVHAELIDDDVFEARKYKFNIICRDTKIEHLLHLLVGFIKPKKKCIFKPNNETKYENLVIPGMLTFNEALKYIDKNYGGIYDYGLGYYWTDDTIFIYPLYSFEPEISPYIVNFYFVGENNITGGSNFHIFKNECYHIITTRKPQSNQLIDKAAENIGNGYMIQRSSLLMDDWVEQEEGEFTVIPDGIIRMQTVNPNTLSASSHNMQFIYGEENCGACKSNIAMLNGTVTTIEWEHALPFIIKPGWKMVYHYDSADTYETKTGSCLKAFYRFESAGRSGRDRLYSCHASITLFTE